MRITPTVASVLREFLEDPSRSRYGFELMKCCEIPSGSLYPILARLERAAWIIGQSESIDPVKEGRPPRKHYRLTETGTVAARAALANFSAHLDKLSARLRLPVTD
ncbi:transcriptional regulator, Acidobacterial, PadR-family [Nocardia otitidiscaviarum]|uniref:Transcriptional regulator, Acidobacterial, PadR-family n=1 Tax=Nocardia otitidiscaviarum TaxID=1823 RepID=A0A379JLQ5_9NOCA|nr:transcriptional regulator, Acidobacterial, PadR-family [Nocardia otitidiscaviarum]